MYKSAWTNEPTVRLLPQRWNWEPGTQVPIMVFTNARSVQVFINDEPVGPPQNYDRNTAEPVFLAFGRHFFKEGELKAVGFDGMDGTGNIIATDVARTAGNAEAIALTADRTFVRNDGYDLVFVEAAIVDSANTILPLADTLIEWHVTGGTIVALDSGNPQNINRFRPKNSDDATNPPTKNFSRSAFNGRAIAIVKPDAGSAEIKITATAPAEDIHSHTVTIIGQSQIGDGIDFCKFEDVTIITGIGIPPEMPTTLGRIRTNGRITPFVVDDWDVLGVDIERTGTYKAYAKVASQKVEVDVIVKEIESIHPVTVTTITGASPTLPRTITVRYSDGSIGAALVKWDAFGASNKNFTINGSLGKNLSITATVNVKTIVSVEKIAVNTSVGVLPRLPAVVTATFADGTQERLGVSWAVTEKDVADPGEQSITGTIMGTDATAIATVSVWLATDASTLKFIANPPENVTSNQAFTGGQLIQRGAQGAPPILHDSGFGTRAIPDGTQISIDIQDKGFKRLKGVVSLSEGGVTGPGAVSAEIYADDKQVFTTDGEEGLMIVADVIGGRYFDIDISGASTIKLITYSRGAETAFRRWTAESDSADWCDIKFMAML